MVQKYGLKEVFIPDDNDLQDEEERRRPKVNIFMSEDFLDPSKSTNDNALILIQGTGAVRAG